MQIYDGRCVPVPLMSTFISQEALVIPSQKVVNLFKLKKINLLLYYFLNALCY